MSEEMYSIVSLIEKVKAWHRDRNLIEGSTDKDQYLKLIQEAGELSDNIGKGNDIKDDIGDMLVVLINIAERNGVSLTDCLNEAWNDIKDRKGRMVDGVFIKEADYDALPDYWEEKGVKVKYVDEDRRATGPLDGPGFELGELDLEEGKEKPSIYKNTVFGTTKYG